MLISYFQYKAFGVNDYAFKERPQATGYIGKEKDTESNLGEHGVRKYDSDLGRFLCPDVMWEKYILFTPYQYSLNDPISNLDWDGKAVQIGTAIAGGIIGGSLEYGSQVFNNLLTSKSNNLGDKIWNACIRDIDTDDIGIATAAGVLAGTTLGLSAWVGVPLNAGISITEDYAKSQVGSKKEEYNENSLMISIGSSLAGDVFGNYIKGLKQATPEAKKLHNNADKMLRIATRRNRNEQFKKAAKAKKIAKSLGELEELVSGKASERVVSETANKLINRK